MGAGQACAGSTEATRVDFDTRGFQSSGNPNLKTLLQRLAISIGIPLDLLSIPRTKWHAQTSPDGEVLCVVQESRVEMRHGADFDEILGVWTDYREPLPKWTCLCWSQDSQLVAIAKSDGSIIVLDRQAELVLRIPSSVRATGSVFASAATAPPSMNTPASGKGGGSGGAFGRKRSISPISGGGAAGQMGDATESDATSSGVFIQPACFFSFIPHPQSRALDAAAAPAYALLFVSFDCNITILHFEAFDESRDRRGVGWEVRVVRSTSVKHVFAYVSSGCLDAEQHNLVLTGKPTAIDTGDELMASVAIFCIATAHPYIARRKSKSLAVRTVSQSPSMESLQDGGTYSNSNSENGANSSSSSESIDDESDGGEQKKQSALVNGWRILGRLVRFARLAPATRQPAVLHCMTRSPCGTWYAAVSLDGDLVLIRPDNESVLQVKATWTQAELNYAIRGPEYRDMTFDAFMRHLAENGLLDTGTDGGIRQRAVRGLKAGRPAVLTWWSPTWLLVAFEFGAVSMFGVPDGRVVFESGGAEYFDALPTLTAVVGETVEYIIDQEINTLRARVQADQVLSIVHVKGAAEGGGHDEEALLKTFITKSSFSVKKVYSGLVSTLQYFTDTFLWHFDSESRASTRHIHIPLHRYILKRIVKTSPEQLVGRKLEAKDYTTALDIAKRYGLDSHLVYKAQWLDSDVNADTIEAILAHVGDTPWVLLSCIERVGDSVDDERELLEYGISRAETLAGKDTGSLAGECLRVLRYYKTCLVAFTEVYYSSSLNRTAISSDERVPVMAALCPSGNEVFSEAFSIFKDTDAVEMAKKYAAKCEISAVLAIFRHLGTVIPYRYAILDQIPEALSPDVFSDLLPEADSNDEKREYMRVLRGEGAHSISREAQDITTFTQYPIDINAVANWYIARTLAVYKETGLLSLCNSFLRIGMEKGIPSLEGLTMDVDVLARLDTRIPLGRSTFDSLSDFQAMAPSALIELIVSRFSKAQALADAFSGSLIPFIDSLAPRIAIARKEKDDARVELISREQDRLGSDGFDGVAVLVNYILKCTPNAPLSNSAAFIVDALLKWARQSQIESRCAQGNMALLVRFLLSFSYSVADISAQLGIVLEAAVLVDRLTVTLESTLLELGDEIDDVARIRAILAETEASSLGPNLCDELYRRVFSRLDSIEMLRTASGMFNEHVASARILAKYGGTVGMLWFVKSLGDEAQQHSMLIRLVRSGGSVRSERSMSDGDWDALLDDLTSLHGRDGRFGAMALLSTQQLYYEYLAGLLNAGRFRIFKRQLARRQLANALGPNDAEELVVQASAEFYDNSNTGSKADGLMKLAYDCLELVPATQRTNAQKALIDATDFLADSGIVGMNARLPIQVRTLENKLELVWAWLCVNFDEPDRGNTCFKLAEKLQRNERLTPSQVDALHGMLLLASLLDENAHDATECALSDALKLCSTWHDRRRRSDDASGLSHDGNLREFREVVCCKRVDRADVPAWQVCLLLAMLPAPGERHRRVELLNLLLVTCPPPGISLVLEAVDVLRRGNEFERVGDSKAKAGKIGEIHQRIHDGLVQTETVQQSQVDASQITARLDRLLVKHSNVAKTRPRDEHRPADVPQLAVPMMYAPATGRFLDATSLTASELVDAYRSATRSSTWKLSDLNEPNRACIIDAMFQVDVTQGLGYLLTIREVVENFGDHYSLLDRTGINLNTILRRQPLPNN